MSNLNHRRNLALALATALSIMLAGCGPDEEEQKAEQQPVAEQAPPASEPARKPATAPAVATPDAASEAAPPARAPTYTEAARATYSGVIEGQSITLGRGGEWRGKPYAEGGASRPRAGLAADFMLNGDFDGDGADESAVLLWTSTGGSGTFDYLAVLDRDANGKVVNVANAALGDRVKLRKASFEDGRIVLDLVQAGPDDAACCPGQNARRSFELDGTTLNEVATEDQGRLSVADLAGEWGLWGLTGSLPALPKGAEVTIAFEGDRIAAGSGCNQFTGSVADGDRPGTLSVTGPLAGTRKMCPEPLMAWEGQLVAALEKLDSYSFMAGRLTLGWVDGERTGTLVLERR